MSKERLLIESLLRIPDKEGNDVDFILNPDQATFDEAKTGRDIIAKYRQGGFSMYPLGLAFVRCLAYRNRRHVIIAHNTDTTQKLLSRVHYMVKHFKGPAPDTKYATQNRIVFGKTDSSITIGTAGNEDFGVGDTITDLHCSEVSRWPRPDALLAGLFQAVPPTGNILLESTGLGVGNYFHTAVMRAARGGQYKLHFFHWLNTPEYSVPMSEEDTVTFMLNLDEALEEPKCAAMGLTPGQIMWRRRKLEEFNYDLRKFHENYPLSLEECFQGTGFSVFNEVNFVASKEWKRQDPWLWVLGDHPKIGLSYVFGVDSAGGTGNDYSVIEGFEVETGEQVLEYRNNMLPPDRFSAKIFELGMRFNEAYLNPERNQHGFVVIKELLNRGYPRRLIHQPKTRSNPLTVSHEVAELGEFGTYTTEITKKLVVDHFAKNVRLDMIIHSEVLRLEMSSFVETDTGKMQAEQGCFDDCVMAAAMAEYVRPRALSRSINKKERASRATPVTRAAVFEAGRAMMELIGRWEGEQDGLPISSHVEGWGDR